MSKVLATFTMLVGSIAVVYSLLAAFGIELSQGQQDAITGVLGLALTLAGLWFHPDVPIGRTSSASPEPASGGEHAA